MKSVLPAQRRRSGAWGLRFKNLGKLGCVADVPVADRIGRVGEREELEGVEAAVVAGEVPAAGGGEAEAGVVGLVAADRKRGQA